MVFDRLFRRLCRLGRRPRRAGPRCRRQNGRPRSSFLPASLPNVCFLRGNFDILVSTDGLPRVVGCYNNRGSFGELALMYNTPRAATIIATSAGALWCLVSSTVPSLTIAARARLVVFGTNHTECHGTSRSERSAMCWWRDITPPPHTHTHTLTHSTPR